MNSWKSPKPVIGAVAMGESYFPRPQLEQQLLDAVQRGEHVLLAAPRRVGKTSLMMAIESQCPEHIRCHFKNIQGIQSEEEFYDAFYELLLLGLKKFAAIEWIKNLMNHFQMKIEGGGFSAAIGKQQSINSRQKIETTLEHLGKGKEQVVLLLDELPEVLNHLNKSGKNEEASNLLNQLREWRQMPELRQKLTFVLAGSIGIHHIVKTIEGRTADLNDLVILPFKPLSTEEAHAYISWALEGASLQADPAIAQYFLDKVVYPIPYFINLMLDHCNRMAMEQQQPLLTEKMLDEAFDKTIAEHTHFEDWSSRLFHYYQASESTFMNEVLIMVSHKEIVDVKALYNLAQKHHLQQQYRNLMDDLVRDGYLKESPQGYFTFLSPFLAAYWKRKHPFYE